MAAMLWVTPGQIFGMLTPDICDQRDLYRHKRTPPVPFGTGIGDFPD
jgi:hypothetical protein